jgi:LysM repeat protein
MLRFHDERCKHSVIIRVCCARTGDVMDEHDFYSDGWRADSRRRETRTRLRREPALSQFRGRLGLAVLVFVLLLPIALMARGGETRISPSALPGAVAVLEPAQRPDRTTIPATTTVPAVTSTVSTESSAVASVATSEPASTPAPAVALAATTAPPQPSTTAAPRCGQDFTVRPGDSWVGLARAAKVTLRQLLAVNGANSSTVIHPGDVICLPPGATKPAPTTTTTKPPPAPPTTARSQRPSTAPPATAPAPATTTPARPPQRTYTKDEIVAIVRDVWPDHLEERALAVVHRESRFDPRAKNFCCYGIFQIYYSVHRSWLAGLGVTSAEQLYDPRTNAIAALTLYQRAGGWGPWT